MTDHAHDLLVPVQPGEEGEEVVEDGLHDLVVRATGGVDLGGDDLQDRAAPRQARGPEVPQVERGQVVG